MSAERRNGATIVAVQGELDLSTHERLSEQLTAAASDGPIVVDMSECGFIDSSGVRALLLGARATEQAGNQPIALAAAGEQVQRILELTGLAGTISVHDTVDEALARLGGD